ncbi:hypothetical protein BJ138DRAFT_1055205 [Hygrophoropsis aurantiaca]|uniref:Uncharacterized protein n=1 Tax=Hygrophoropsis aurantiaca TaxID=72124 RepID=A0ACB8AR98_9AGAM|nr:hypothetical protein BJ138DRAFT_1055205 [Hygrophoropsis aurantiaca]
MTTIMTSSLFPDSLSSTPASKYHSLLPSPSAEFGGGGSGSASSSSVSLTAEDEENVTITANRSMQSRKKGKRKSQEDIRLLAISTHITELSYSISDIQTRIFEIQELRHKSHSSGDAAGTTAIIDKALMNLDERLETVSEGMKSVNESVASFVELEAAPVGISGEATEKRVLLRKHTTLLGEWEAVQSETDVLREELKEDKWLTVFRTVTEQADGMMSSLEKAVNRCQDFIWQVHRKGTDDTASFTSSLRSEKSPVSLEVFNELISSFEAKKKHYVPATSKVLAIIDNGVQNRVTKNGETLRRHAESAKRWKTLKDRMAKTDTEMEMVRKLLVGAELTPSETGSSASGATHNTANGYLATPPNGSAKSRGSSRATSAASTISRSMSPLRKFARKITGNNAKSPATPAPPLPVSRESSQGPSSEPVKAIRRQRTTLFSFRGSPTTPQTPNRGHKYSHSLTPDSSPVSKRLDPNSTVKSRSSKQPWNSSVKVEPEERGGSTIKPTPPKRPSVLSPDQVSHVPSTPSRRSVSRSSNASSRPWSPVTSSISTAPSSNPSVPPLPPLYSRPPSRSQTPGIGTTPRPRPKTPSHIPAPAMHWRSVSSRQAFHDDDDDAELTTLMQRAFSTSQSLSSINNIRSHTPGGTRIPPPRPPSRSMIPVPSFHISSESRPSTTMSFYHPESPTTNTRGSGFRAQTPESALRATAQQVPFYQVSGVRTTARPTLPGKLPPSSFRDGSVSRAPSSRPGSRAGAYTPTMEQTPVHQYVPANAKDPLDAEVAAIVNSLAHGLLIERVDPPLRAVPREGEEIKASYAFSNSLSRKVVTCRLTTMTRLGSKADGTTTTKKVMCRVGGGWQDLQLYMLNRQAGM